MMAQVERFSFNSSEKSIDFDHNNTNLLDRYTLVFNDIDEYYNRLNLTNLTDINTYEHPTFINCTFGENNNTNLTCSTDLTQEHYKNYWALLLVFFPIITLFGNVLVILSVYRERTLQTATNYFIVSLALADLLVAVVVMPFAVYVLVNGSWALPGFVCDFYIAMDVTCSTSSIFNLVAISIDRFIAVTQPIKYAKHKNNRRVWLTIVLVWVISAAIGSPIVLGLNNTPNRTPDACLFYNSDFIIYSSLSSFFIPCIIMMFLYYSIFKALHTRAMQQRANRRPYPSETKSGFVIENLANTRKIAETALGPATDEQATNTGSGSADEDDDVVEADCHVISNDKSNEFILTTVVEETAISSVVTLTAPTLSDPNGNNDSGYVHSTAGSMAPDSPRLVETFRKSSQNNEDPELRAVPITNSRLASIRSIGSKKEKKATAAARFTIYKVNKASKKKREKSSAKKERKATKTLAIVLGVFLICWLPFFSCNILDAICSKLNLTFQPGVSAFLLTTWLGYMNSCVNPIIYTIFNPEFRKAFKKIMCLGP